MGGRDLKLALKLPPQEGNKTEVAFGLHLASRLQAGEIQWYAFEPVKLRLAKKTFYTPDFLVLTAGGELIVYEVKGFWRDDAKVKIKCAKAKYPFIRFIAATKRTYGSGWKYEEF